MAIDLNTIENLDNAKLGKYGGEDLDDNNKALFDASKSELKDSAGNLSLQKIRAAAKLLDEVMWADKALTKDTALLKSLEDAKTKNEDDYKLVNTVSKQVDNAITRLKGLKESDTKYENKTKKEWEAEKIKAEAELLTLKNSLEKKRGEKNKKIKPAADALTDLQNAERELGDTELILEDIRNGTSKVEIDNSLKLIWAKNDAFSKAYTDGRVDSTFVADVEVEPGYKFLRPDTSINNIGGEFARIFSEIDEKELFKVAEDGANSAFFADYLSQKDEVKLAWARVKKCIPDIKWVEGRAKLSTGKTGGPYRMIAYKEAISKSSDESFKKLYFLSKKEGGRDDFSSPQEAFDCWTRYIRWADIFLIMESLFPKGKNGNNPLLDKSKNHLKDSVGSSVVDKEYEIKFTASNKAVTAGDVAAKDEFSKGQKILSKKGKLSNQSNPEDNLFDFFWKVFGSSPAHALKKKEKDTDKIKKNLLQFEIDNGNIVEKKNFLAFHSFLIIEQFKEIFSGKVKKDGRELKIEWNSEVRQIILDYLQKEVKRVTNENQLKAFKEIPVIKSLLADNSVKDIFVPVTSNSLAVRTVSSSMMLPLSSGKFEDLNKLLVLATFRRNEKQIAYDSLTKGADVAKLYNEIADLDLRIGEKEAEIKKIKNAIKYFDDSDLEGLKARFDTLYDGGTENGTKKAKYTTAQLSEMKALLWAINKNEIGGLNSAYKVYSNDLDVNVLTPAASHEGIISQLLGSQKLTFKERVEDALKVYESVPDGVENELRSIKVSLEELEKIRKLTDRETAEKEQINYYLDNKKYKDEVPQSTLTLSELKTALKGTDAAATDATYHLDTWKTTNKFKSENDIKNLISLVHNDDGTIKADFATHLASHKTWGIDVIAKGDDQWETFIKNKPQHIIGSIKLFQYENDTDFRSESDTKIDAANSDPKADPSKPWNKSDKVELSRILSKIAIGETGEDLIKAQKEQEDHTKNSKTPWYAHWGYAPIWVPSILIVGLAALAYVYWEEIVNWWNGPTEERGEAEMTGEEEEKD